MSAKNLTEEEFEKLIERLIAPFCDEPITVGSPGHKEFVQDILEDFFKIQRKYTVTIKSTEKRNYQTTGFSEYEAQEKVYNRASNQDKKSGVYLIHTDDLNEEHIDTVRGWE